MNDQPMDVPVLESEQVTYESHCKRRKPNAAGFEPGSVFDQECLIKWLDEILERRPPLKEERNMMIISRCHEDL